MDSLIKLFFCLSVFLLFGEINGVEGSDKNQRMYGFRPTKLFVFGDSYADTGNIKKSLSSSWKFPYGITFPGKPAGRFSDGRVSTDFLETWSLGPWVQQIDSSLLLSFKSAISSSGSWIGLPPYGFSSNIFPWVCWFLWIARNQLLFEKKPSTAAEIMMKSILAVKEWDQAQWKSEPPPSIGATNTSPPLCHNPSPATILCNTDAAWRSESGNAGLAWIFSDQEGRVIGKGSAFQSHVSSACMAEALAVRSALVHASELNYNSIWLRSDSQVLIRAL